MKLHLLGRSGSLLLTVALLAGLLNFPVTCACGAAVPHGHSLFQLAGHHHHGPADAHDHGHAHDHSHDTQPATATALREMGTQGWPHLSTATDPTPSASAVGTLPAPNNRFGAGPTPAISQTTHGLNGRSIAPESPPPRRA